MTPKAPMSAPAPLYERALAISEKALGPGHPNVATALSGLAALYRAQGAYERAGPLCERALAIWEKALGPDHPDVALSLNNLARLYRAQGADERAAPLFERALAIFEKALGPDHPEVATSLNNLAVLYRDQGAYERARPLFERALAIYEKALGPDHPHTKIVRAESCGASTGGGRRSAGASEDRAERTLSLRLRQEIQALLRGACVMRAAAQPQPGAAVPLAAVAVSMRRRCRRVGKKPNLMRLPLDLLQCSGERYILTTYIYR